MATNTEMVMPKCTVKDLQIRVTPEMARCVLDEHTNYRQLSVNRRNAYALRMKEGKWKPTSFIMFDDTGRLVDGQTRLAAVVKCGIPQTFCCVGAFPRDAIVTVDNNQPRSPGQVLRSERGVRNGNLIGAFVKGVEFGADMPGRAILNVETVDLYDKHDWIINILFADGFSFGGRKVSAINAIPFGRAIRLYPDKGEELRHAMRDMYEMRFVGGRMEGLRFYWQWATQTFQAQGGHSYRRVAYLKLARAILAFLNNETLAKLYAAPSDPFTIEEGDE